LSLGFQVTTHPRLQRASDRSCYRVGLDDGFHCVEMVLLRRTLQQSSSCDCRHMHMLCSTEGSTCLEHRPGWFSQEGGSLMSGVARSMVLVQHLGCTFVALSLSLGRRKKMTQDTRVFPAGARTPPWAHQHPNFLSFSWLHGSHTYQFKEQYTAGVFIPSAHTTPRARRCH
jgi:hypothetical protein